MISVWINCWVTLFWTSVFPFHCPEWRWDQEGEEGREEEEEEEEEERGKKEENNNDKNNDQKSGSGSNSNSNSDSGSHTCWQENLQKWGEIEKEYYNDHIH